MSFSKLSAVAGVIAFASKVAAHGTVTGIVADGIYYEGYSANFQYMQTAPVVVGWSIPEDLGNGFIAPDAYNTSDIICHLGATNAGTSAPVAAGGTVELQWTAWPSSHHGPVIDYLANCGGDCTTVDKTTLEWFKIDAQGLYDDTTVPGTWASDTLIANNNSWTVTIPSDIASGNYVLRHEIIALHSAGEADGAQNYPQCVNLMVSGSGTATPTGTLGTALYSETDPGIIVNIYSSIASYTIPGPALYSGAVSMSETQQPAATAVGTGVNAIATGGVAASTTAASSAAAQITSSSSAAIEATSSAAGIAISSSSISVSEAAAQVTSAPLAPTAQYSNSTISTSSKKSACKSKSASVTVSSSKSKSACKAKTSSSSSFVASSVVNVAAAQITSSALSTTSAASVTIATTLSAIKSESSSTTSSAAGKSTASAESTTTTDSTVAEPAGTTLGDLLSWISSFYTGHSGTSYTDATVARRHARDVVARDFDMFEGVKEHATGVVSGGAHPIHHHYRPTGTEAFGAFASGFAQQSGKGNGKGGVRPTDSFSAGAARPTGGLMGAFGEN